MAEGLLEEANAIGEKRQRQRHTPHHPQLTRAPGVCRQNLATAIPANQIRARTVPARAMPAGFCEYKKGVQLCGSHSGSVLARVRLR